MKTTLLFFVVALGLLGAIVTPPRPIPPVRPLPGEGRTGRSRTPSPTPGHEAKHEITPYAAAPACAHHDARAYHGLWDAAQGCHYNHTHGDDPHEVDDIFGDAFYGWAGGEISYPWQTPDENLHKHGAYLWFVRRDLPCAPAGDGAPCISDFRAQLHGVGAAHGAVVNFHSAWLEARVCAGRPWRCGIVRVGGWQGPVDLSVDGRVVLQREESGNRFFAHYYETGNRAFGTWYTGAASGLYSIIPQFEDMWNTVPPGADAEEILAAAHWFCAGESGAFANIVYAGCAANSSRVQPHVIRFDIPRRMLSVLDSDGDGLANFEGFVDRMGELAPACREPGPECIPFSLQDVPAMQGEFQYRGQAREYDICFSPAGAPLDDCRHGVPSGWIEFPIH